MLQTQYLVVTYGKILMDNIADEKYSKIEKTNISIEDQNYEAVGYSLTLNQDDINQIAVAILTKAKDDEQTIDILNKLISDENQTEQVNVQEILEQSLNDLQNQNFEETIITISVYHEGNKIIKTQITLNDIAEFTVDLNMSQKDKNYLAFIAEAAVDDSENEAQGTVMQLTMEKQILNSIVYYNTNITSGVSDYQITMNTTLGNIVNNQMENNSKITIINTDATVEASYAKTTQLATEEVEIQELTDTNSVVINNYPAEQLNTFFESLGEKAGGVLEEKIGKLNITISGTQDILNNVNSIASGLITIGNANGMGEPVGVLGIFITISMNESVKQSLELFENANNAHNKTELQAIKEIIMTIQVEAMSKYFNPSYHSEFDDDDIKVIIEENLPDEYNVTDWENVSFDTTQPKIIGTIKITNGKDSYLLDFTNTKVERIEEETNNNNSEGVINTLNAQANRAFNSEFESSAGTNKTGSIAKNMLSTIITNNESNSADDSRTVYVKIGGELKEKISNWSNNGETSTEKLNLLRNTISTTRRYNIKLTYNDEGFVHIVEITYAN